MKSWQFIVTTVFFATISSGTVFADCPAGSTKGAEIFCIYDNGNDGGQFQLCLADGQPSCAYGIAYPGTTKAPEPFHGCDAPYSDIAYCGVAGGGNDGSDDGEIVTPTGCDLGQFVEAFNANGSITESDKTLITNLK